MTTLSQPSSSTVFLHCPYCLPSPPLSPFQVLCLPFKSSLSLSSPLSPFQVLSLSPFQVLSLSPFQVLRPLLSLSSPLSSPLSPFHVLYVCSSISLACRLSLSPLPFRVLSLLSLFLIFDRILALPFVSSLFPLTVLISPLLVLSLSASLSLMSSVSLSCPLSLSLSCMSSLCLPFVSSLSLPSVCTVAAVSFSVFCFLPCCLRVSLLRPAFALLPSPLTPPPFCVVCLPSFSEQGRSFLRLPSFFPSFLPPKANTLLLCFFGFLPSPRCAGQVRSGQVRSGAQTKALRHQPPPQEQRDWHEVSGCFCALKTRL